jgi:hypothetical protein
MYVTLRDVVSSSYTNKSLKMGRRLRVNAWIVGFGVGFFLYAMILGFEISGIKANMQSQGANQLEELQQINASLEQILDYMEERDKRG